MSNRDVQVWFQNRRAKKRRLAADSGYASSQTTGSNSPQSFPQRARTVSLRDIPSSAIAAGRPDLLAGMSSAIASQLCDSPQAMSNSNSQRPQPQTYAHMPYRPLGNQANTGHWNVAGGVRRSRSSSSPLPPTSPQRIPLYSSPTVETLPELHSRGDSSPFALSDSSSISEMSGLISDFRNEAVIGGRRTLTQPFPNTQIQRSPLGLMEACSPPHQPMAPMRGQNDTGLTSLPFLSSRYSVCDHETRLAPLHTKQTRPNVLDMRNMVNDQDVDIVESDQDATEVHNDNEAANLLSSNKRRRADTTSVL
ncbi:hypothetical protein BSLG_001728 [Batrachochytrium salamandrivorans]|nr:hypothetical protein BSLG_001728 [Batrachochytrium salamandrivorans]